MKTSSFFFTFCFLILLGAGCAHQQKPLDVPELDPYPPTTSPEETPTKAESTPTASRDALGTLFSSSVTVTNDEEHRYISASGLPDHETGPFPNANNPHTISEQSYAFRVPMNPDIAGAITANTLSRFGVAINGVVFDPGAAEFWEDDRNSGWQYEAMSGAIDLGLDSHHAHVQPTGAYHYHGLPTGLLGGDDYGTFHPEFLGLAADGFPMYGLLGYQEVGNPQSGTRKLNSSYRVKTGTRPDGPGGAHDGTFVADYEYVEGLGDLDECNGRTGVTQEFPEGTYYYVITDTFPFIPRCFTGTPDQSFAPQGQGSRVQDVGRRLPPGGPPPAGNPPPRPDGPTPLR